MKNILKNEGTDNPKGFKFCFSNYSIFNAPEIKVVEIKQKYQELSLANTNDQKVLYKTHEKKNNTKDLRENLRESIFL